MATTQQKNVGDAVDPQDGTPLHQVQALIAAAGSGGPAITALTSDVTATGPGSAAATIAAGAVTNAKRANMPASTMSGNNTGAPGVPLDLTAAQIKTLLALAAVASNGLATSLSGLTPGSIPFEGPSAITEDNANLFWDRVNAFLGLGTNLPGLTLDAKLNVNGIAAIGINNPNAGTSATAEVIASNGTTNLITGVSGTGFAAGGALANLAADRGFIFHPNGLFIGITAGNIGFYGDNGSGVLIERARIQANGQLVVLDFAAGGVITAAAGGLLSTHAAAGFSVLGKATTGAGANADLVAGADSILCRSGSANLGFGKATMTSIEDLGSGRVFANDSGNLNATLVSPLQLVPGSGQISINVAAARAALDIWDGPYQFECFTGVLGAQNPASTCYVFAGKILGSFEGPTLRASYTKMQVEINLSDVNFSGHSLTLTILKRSGHGGSPVTLLTLGPYGGAVQDSGSASGLTLGLGDEINAQLTGTVTAGDNFSISVNAWFQ